MESPSGGPPVRSGSRAPSAARPHPPTPAPGRGRAGRPGRAGCRRSARTAARRRPAARTGPRTSWALRSARDGEQVGGEGVDHRGLAGPGVAAEQDEAAAVGDHLVEHAAQPGPLVGASDQVRGPAARRTARSDHGLHAATRPPTSRRLRRRGAGRSGSAWAWGAGSAPGGATTTDGRRWRAGRGGRWPPRRRSPADAARRGWGSCSRVFMSTSLGLSRLRTWDELLIFAGRRGLRYLRCLRRRHRRQAARARPDRPAQPHLLGRRHGRDSACRAYAA